MKTRLCALAVALSVFLATPRAEAAVALVQSVFQRVERTFTNSEVTTAKLSVLLPTIYGTASNTIFVMVIGSPGTCQANFGQALTSLGSGVYSITVGTGGTNNYAVRCFLSGVNDTDNAMVGAFEVSGALGTVDIATAVSLLAPDPTVSITPTVNASLIIAFGWATRSDYPSNRPVLFCPNTSAGTTRLKYWYAHDFANSSKHEIRWFQRLDALGGLGASTLGMSGGFQAYGTWSMTAVAIHPA
jgi:hypothetical protein